MTLQEKHHLGNLPSMTRNDVLALFKRTGALLDGHFILRSGLHSRQFFQCAIALQHMPDVELLGAALAERCHPLQPQTVIAPAMGGLVIGQEVARQLRCRFIFAEKEDGRLVLRRGFRIAPGERCLVVEDVITQGGRVRETIEIVEKEGGVIPAIAVLVDRSGGQLQLSAPIISLLSLQVESFPADQLPPDLAQIPAMKPGSK